MRMSKKLFSKYVYKHGGGAAQINGLVDFGSPYETNFEMLDQSAHFDFIDQLRAYAIKKGFLRKSNETLTIKGWDV